MKDWHGSRPPRRLPVINHIVEIIMQARGCACSGAPPPLWWVLPCSKVGNANEYRELRAAFEKMSPEERAKLLAQMNGH